MTMPDQLTALDEAALIGITAPNVSRARQKEDHPANGKNAGILFNNPRYKTAPRDEVIAWWGARGKGPAATAPKTPTPDGWEPRQWAALTAAGQGTAPAGVMAQVLRDRRVIDATGAITDEGRALLAAHHTDRVTP
jgi:hypothetical protein